MRYTMMGLVLVGSFAFVEAVMGNVFVYTSLLSGPNESPANASPGTGTATITYNDVAHTLEVDVTFSGLLGNTTASHIHGPTALPDTGTAGVATMLPTFAGFPLGVTAGNYDHVFSLSDTASYNPSFITAHGGTAGSAEVALTDAMQQGRAYLNIHTTVFGGGEIRGFLHSVPDASSTAPLLFLGILGLLGLVRRARVG